MNRWLKSILIIIFLFFVIPCFSQQFSHLQKYGIEYSFYQLDNPRPVRIHVLKIDFSKNKLESSVIAGKDPDGDGPVEAILTDPFELAKDKDIVAFINTNPWDSFPDEKGERNRKWYRGQHIDITGLAAINGRIISKPEGGTVSVWTDKTNRFYISRVPYEKILNNGVAGWYQIVDSGKIIPKQSEVLNPLTAIGIDKTGYIVWFVVADGRQKGFSEGMTHYELADFMVKLGCWNVALMDGGGSSIMALIDEKDCLKVVNSPSDRILWMKKIRPLPVILALKKNS